MTTLLCETNTPEPELDLSGFSAILRRIDPIRSAGEVVELVGLLVESRGPATAIGDFCEIRTRSGTTIRTQVVGFRDGRVLSMPLEETGGLGLGDSHRRARRREYGGGFAPIAGPSARRIRSSHGRRPGHHSSRNQTSQCRPAQPTGTRAHHRETHHRHSGHRRTAAMRKRPAYRHLWRQRGREEHAAGLDGAFEFGRSQRDRAHRRA